MSLVSPYEVAAGVQHVGFRVTYCKHWVKVRSRYIAMTSKIINNTVISIIIAIAPKALKLGLVQGTDLDFLKPTLATRY